MLSFSSMILVKFVILYQIMGGNIVDAIDGGYEISGHLFLFASQS